MMTIKEYAESRGVTHQAVYKQLSNHSKELEGLIIPANGKKGRMLTDEAVALLDNAKEEHPVIGVRVREKEKIQQLEDNIKILLNEKSVLQDKLTELYEWKAEQASIIAEAKYTLITVKEKEEKIGELEQKCADSERAAREENERAHRLEDEFRERISELLEENERIKEQYENEKNKSWFQKLFHKA